MAYQTILSAFETLDQNQNPLAIRRLRLGFPKYRDQFSLLTETCREYLQALQPLIHLPQPSPEGHYSCQDNLLTVPWIFGSQVLSSPVPTAAFREADTEKVLSVLKSFFPFEESPLSRDSLNVLTNLVNRQISRHIWKIGTLEFTRVRLAEQLSSIDSLARQTLRSNSCVDIYSGTSSDDTSLIMRIFPSNS